MKERPILLYGHEVRAILEGRKTKMRRAVKPQPGQIPLFDDYFWTFQKSTGIWSDSHGWQRKCPYGQPGDRIWVRETFCPVVDASDQSKKILYRATHYDELGAYAGCWKPSIYGVYARRFSIFRRYRNRSALSCNC